MTIIALSFGIVRYFFANTSLLYANFVSRYVIILKIASDYSNMFEKRCLCGYLTRMKSLSSKYIINFGNLYSLCNLIRLLVCRHQEIYTVHIKDAITLIYVLHNNILYSRQTSILISNAKQ